MDDCLGLVGRFAVGVGCPVPSRNSQQQREQCLSKQSLPGEQPGNSGAAQGRERREERELSVKGKELKLGQVSHLTSQEPQFPTLMVTLTGP